MSSITYNHIRQNRSNCFLKPTTLSYKTRAGETGLSWGTLLLVERQGGEAAMEAGAHRLNNRMLSILRYWCPRWTTRQPISLMDTVVRTATDRAADANTVAFRWKDYRIDRPTAGRR